MCESSISRRATSARTRARLLLTASCATLCYMPRYKIRSPHKSVGVRELRQNLSVYLERVKKGEALTVTARGQEVAILRPMPKTDDLAERLIAEGRVTRPTRHIRDVLRDIGGR